MSAKHLSTKECIDLLDESVRQAVWDSLARYKSKGVLVFSNHDFGSSRLGHMFAIGYGPENTLTEVPADGKCRVTPPDGDMAWRYYLDAYSDDLVAGAIQESESERGQ